MHSALRLNLFHLKCTDREFNPDPKTLDGLCPDGAVNPDQYPGGWYNLRFISQVEKDNTQALIPTMNMARQLSEASAWELFAAQNLTSADNEKMWQAQGRMLTAQSLTINALLQALREQGFDTTAIEQQEQEISRSLRQQGELVGQRLQLRQQQQQLSQQIVAAADEIARLAQGQANNATTSAGATQAGIYDLIEQDQRQAAESALDRLIDIDLEYVNQMNELRLSALRVQQMVMNLGLEQIQKMHQRWKSSSIMR